MIGRYKIPTGAANLSAGLSVDNSGVYECRASLQVPPSVGSGYVPQPLPDSAWLTAT